ncbi:MAG: UDP-glucose 4-epimerase [Candidatus Accumulibacter adjunctus]|uniref:UDP-glucose 4-epimerase n=1 Tax=Candidatus Accumulibacter adjunctus TaxID=1454001 RepID=A0A011PLJ1_9PROT|nr:MAG: UDP-glucose 4-epimerase [Candidatus Accumulibacter adjunctus]
MRIALTGASGMLAGACLRHLAARGDQIVALGRGDGAAHAPLPPGVVRRTTDYGLADLRPLLRDVEAVIHLGALRANAAADRSGCWPYFEANVRSTENLLIAARANGVRSFCLASSIAVYGRDHPRPWRESDLPAPQSPYGISKLACEHLLALHGEQAGMRVVALRLAQIVGDDRNRQQGMLLQFIARARRQQSLPLWGSGAAARDLVYVEDVARAVVLALDSEHASGVHNIGGERAFSNLEVAQTINQVFGNPAGLVLDATRPDEAGSQFMNCERARRQLGWQRQWDLRAALEDLRRQGA